MPAMHIPLSLFAAFVPGACSRSPSNDAVANTAAPTGTMPAPAPASGLAGFQPLASDAVKDAIHRALSTGRTQRWADGALSGYAVPSTTTDAHGCRAVRYTIDQQPGVPFETINACDAGR